MADPRTRGWWGVWNPKKVSTFHYFDAHNVRGNRSNCGRMVKPDDAVLMPDRDLQQLLQEYPTTTPVCGSCERIVDLTYAEADR